MALARWSGVVQDAAGNAVSGASIEVRSEQTGALAVLFSDRDGEVGRGNPFTSADPTAWFHVEGGSYFIRASLGAMEQEWRFVSIGTAAELDAEALQAQINLGLETAVRTDEQDLSDVQRAQAWLNLGIERFKWLTYAIGDWYEADDGVAGVEIPPQDASLGLGVWIELTAGLTGTGQFNNGKLTSESVSGSAPLVSATAVVSIVGSPMNGQTIRLLNTERRMKRPGAPGTLQGDAFQDHLHTQVMWRLGNAALTGGGERPFPYNPGGGATGPIDGADTSAPKVNGANGTPRTANETRPKNVGVRVFRRVG